MAYIGNTPQDNIVFYTLGIDKFNGDGVTTAFTLTRELGQDLDVEVLVNNVQQEPGIAYTVSGDEITFTEAPSEGSNNVQCIFRTQNVVTYNEITSDQFAASSVTEQKIANDAVTTNKIADGAVTTAKMSANSVTSAVIANDGVKSNNILNSAVITTKIADSAVTTDKIAAGAVTSAKIATGAVGSSQLSTGLSVNITGGSIQGITDLSVADGGTGASDAATARTNLGLGSMATQSSSSVSITGGSISGTSISGLGGMASQNPSSVAITGGSITGITDLAIADGGTGASDASTARTNLGLGTMALQSATTPSVGTLSATGINMVGLFQMYNTSLDRNSTILLMGSEYLNGIAADVEIDITSYLKTFTSQFNLITLKVAGYSGNQYTFGGRDFLYVVRTYGVRWDVDDTTPVVVGANNLSYYESDTTNFPVSRAVIVVSGNAVVLRLRRNIAATGDTETKYTYEIHVTRIW